MTRAYQKTYLSKAQATLGEAFDHGINTCHIDGDTFIKLFIGSSLSKRFEKGDPAIIAGKSGIELANDIIFETTGKQYDNDPSENYSRSIEYWIGWAVCYYQWYSSKCFTDIFNAISYDDLCNMYYTLHEADISKFVDIVSDKLKEVYKETNLKRIRSYYGCSQSELAKASGVSLRSIQMYEQRNKDINKASAETIYNLSKVLGCDMEDLLERN